MAQAIAREGVRWRLGARTRKSILLVHIASAGTWLGIDLVMAILVVTALRTDDPRTKALAFQALELVAVWPLLVTGLVCLLSGVLLGFGSRYGLVRYWWVAVKLVLNLVLTGWSCSPGPPGGPPMPSRPAVPGPGSGDPGGRDLLPADRVPDGLLVAFVLAVFKPWGRIRKPSPSGDADVPPLS